LRFEVLGPPQGKSRPRVCFKAGRAWAYTPKDTRDYEAKIKKAARGGKKLSGNVWMRISAVFPIPKSATKSKREEMLSGRVRPTKKPDMDNIIKTIMDALNGIAYEDDKQVCEIHVEKIYGEIPKVMVEVRGIEYDKL